MKTPETELAKSVRARLEKLISRFKQQEIRLAMPKFKTEAIRQLELMDSQLDCVRDMKGPAKQFGVILWPRGCLPHHGDSDSTELSLTAIIIATSKQKLKSRLAMWARWDPDCDVVSHASDKEALRCLDACYATFYVDALE